MATAGVSGAVSCSNCGGAVPATYRYCPFCGRETPSRQQRFCSRCGRPVSAGDKFCSGCGTSNSDPVQPQNPHGEALRLALPHLAPYYQQEFTKIFQTNETYKGKWNWAAFLFGGLWALTKGLWLPTVIAFLSGFLTAGATAIFYWFVFGVRGNYMYYSKVIKKHDVPI